MKKQIIQVLWGIANGQPQAQGETVVYPNIREQLNAIKALMSIEGWEEEEVPIQQQSTPAECSTTSVGQPTTPAAQPTTPAAQPTTPTECPTAPTQHPTSPAECPMTFTAPRPVQPRQRPARKKQLFIRGTSIPIG